MNVTRQTLDPPAVPRGAIWRDVLIVVLAGLAARLVWGALYWGRSPAAGVLQADAWSHFDLARQAYLADSWRIGTGPFYQPPLYAYLLLLLHRCGVHDPMGVAIFQSVLGLVAGVLTWWLARQVLSRGWAVGAAILVLTAGLPILYENSVLPTTVGAVLHLAGLAGLLCWWKRSRPGWLVAGGFAAGLACIARPHFLAAAAFQAVWVAWLGWRTPGSKWGKAVLPVLLYGAAAAVGPAATLYHNITVGGDRVLICTNGGVTFCMGNGPGAVGFLAPVPGLAPEIEKQRTESIRLASQAVGRPLKPSEASRWWYEHGLAWIFQNPKEAVLLAGRKVLLMGNRRSVGVNTLYSFESSCVPALRLFAAPCIVILLLGLVAFLTLDRAAPPAAVLLVSSILTYVAVSLLFYVSDRFRAAALPALAILGLAWLCEVWRRRSLRWRDLAAVAVAAIVVFAPAEWWLAMPRGTLDRTLHGLAWYNLGAVAERKHQVGTAEEHYLHALETNPNLGIAHKNLGVLLAKAGRRAEAEPHLRRACQLLPTDGEAQRNLEIFLLDGQARPPETGSEDSPG